MFFQALMDAVHDDHDTRCPFGVVIEAAYGGRGYLAERCALKRGHSEPHEARLSCGTPTSGFFVHARVQWKHNRDMMDAGDWRHGDGTP